jgi:hypothetical protein
MLPPDRSYWWWVFMLLALVIVLWVACPTIRVM